VKTFAALVAAPAMLSRIFALTGGLAAMCMAARDRRRISPFATVAATRACSALSMRLNHRREPRSGVPPGLPFDWLIDALPRGLSFALITSAGAFDYMGKVPGLGTREACHTATSSRSRSGVLPHSSEHRPRDEIGGTPKYLELSWSLKRYCANTTRCSRMASGHQGATAGQDGIRANSSCYNTRFLSNIKFLGVTRHS
jgi:hypothetical protein